jgi:hypothetical protein
MVALARETRDRCRCPAGPSSDRAARTPPPRPNRAGDRRSRISFQPGADFANQPGLSRDLIESARAKRMSATTPAALNRNAIPMR